MKRTTKSFICLGASLMMASSVCMAKTELYALDGRTLFVEDNQIEVYTAPGMGWFKEKPVTMYSADGRTLVVAADQVEAHKAVGWYLEGELDAQKDNQQNNEQDSQQGTDNEQTVPDTTVDVEKPSSNKIFIKYTDNTIIQVPSNHVETYKLLGWTLVDGDDASSDSVIMYNSDGESKVVSVDEVSKYELAGWSTTKPNSNLVTIYSFDGTTKNVDPSEVEAYKEKGWGTAFDEAVYTYAAKGDGGENIGAVAMLENKQYELAFNNVQNAIEELENTESEYLSMLYYLRSNVTDAWREAANSPLGFINYWFNTKDGKKLVVFEYRNVSNSQIQSFKINFDICDKDGEVIETNSGSYFVNNLKMLPCDKKRVGWAIESGDNAQSVKNVKVLEATFSDGTSWKASN